MIELQNRVLALPEAEKRQIFEALKSDLDGFDDAILPILRTRARELDSSEVKTIPAAEAFSAIKATYQQKFGE
jgi:hypothetical protein